MPFSKDLIKIDPAAECERIVSFLRREVRQEMRRYGGVVGISGGVDSSVVLALCVRAFGPERVTALMMPEKDSDPESETLARQVAACYGVEPVLEDITPVLDGFGCYPRRDEAIRRVFPEYDATLGYKAKIVLPQNLLDEDTLNVFSLTIVTPEGEEKNQRLPVRDYFQIVAASNFKQRTRMAMLYYHAELRNYAVIGTANKNEHDQGFFVKFGDGGVDVKPITHLYKTQVYQLAEYLDVPEVIRQRPP
ncbi:MAG TPA: NAD(+) synthase, partial [Anaerolineales bacterium]|nr:NAD(+) synthase [Anaerolineales bacterium]